MSQLYRIPTQDFDGDVAAVALDDRFILVGQVTGVLSAVYHKNGVKVFSSKISEVEITAVCCEEQDEDDNPIFYAGDRQGVLYTVNKKGAVLAQARLQAKQGRIHTISNRGKYSVYAYTNTGSFSFSHATTDFRQGHFSTSTANYSVDGDGSLHRKRGAGDYPVTMYDCRTPATAVATVGMECGKRLRNYNQVSAYAVMDEEYRNLVEEGTARTVLDIFCPNHKIVRTLQFRSPVKQIMSCRHHAGQAEIDRIYILLWDGDLFQVGWRNTTNIAFDHVLGYWVHGRES